MDFSCMVEPKKLETAASLPEDSNLQLRGHRTLGVGAHKSITAHEKTAKIARRTKPSTTQPAQQHLASLSQKIIAQDRKRWNDTAHQICAILVDRSPFRT